MLYDFSKPEDIPEALQGTFDMVVADPPFITRQARSRPKNPFCYSTPCDRCFVFHV